MNLLTLAIDIVAGHYFGGHGSLSGKAIFLEVMFEV